MRPAKILICIPASLALAACISISDEPAESRTIRRSVEFEPVEKLRAEIHMPAGNLLISSGTGNIMDGEFTFTTEALEPKAVFSKSGEEGRLVVEPAQRKEGVQVQGPNQWTIRLNSGVPTDLEVRLGAGKSSLDLAGLTLSRVDLNMGVGECEMNLVGEWDRDLPVEVRGGVGQLKVRVPNHLGVVADIKGGLGDINVRGLRKEGDRYVNDAYGETSVTLKLDIKGGIGQINLTAVD